MYLHTFPPLEELEATLRSHKAAIDETKSAQRDAAGAFFEECRRLAASPMNAAVLDASTMTKDFAIYSVL